MKHAREDYNRIQDPDNLIPEDEAVFLLRAQDTLMPSILMDYAKSALLVGSSDDMIRKVVEHALLVRRQQTGKDSYQVIPKVPDL